METIKHQGEHAEAEGVLFDAQAYEVAPTGSWEHPDAMDVDTSLMPKPKDDSLVCTDRQEYRGWMGVFIPKKKEIIIEIASPSGHVGVITTNSLSLKNARAVFRENVDSLTQLRQQADSSPGGGVWQIGQKVRLKSQEALKNPTDKWGKGWLSVELDEPLILRRGRTAECKEFSPQMITDHPFDCDCSSCWPGRNEDLFVGDRPELEVEPQTEDEKQSRLEALAEDTRTRMKRTAQDIFCIGSNLPWLSTAQGF